MTAVAKRRTWRVRGAFFLAGIGLAGIGLLAGSIGWVRVMAAGRL